jgi:UDP-N-acetylglucosamine 2-epimerase (non-hydrolysing)
MSRVHRVRCGMPASAPASPSVLAVVGARPNFVKAAPVIHALRGTPGVDVRILHTGQHYDAALSDVFIGQLGLPEPDHHLGVGSG